MFDDKIKVESIPRRVYEFCKIVSKKDIDVSDLRNKILPPDLSNNIGEYFGAIRDAALELELVNINENIVHFIGEKECVQNLDNFRRYCNSVVWKKHNTLFYKLAEKFLDSNLDWLKYGSITKSNDIFDEIRKDETIQDSDLQRHLLGERFWLSFLGLGFIYESTGSVFLPNMYVALKDFIIISNIEKNKQLTITEFINKLYNHASVALKNCMNTKHFNFAFSAALRELSDNQEIVLERILDSKDVWYLYKQESHNIGEITHITVKGVK